MHDGDRITLTLQALPLDGIPADCRLRRLLKAMLRQYGFRCVRYGPPGVPEAASRPLPHLAAPDAAAGLPGALPGTVRIDR